MKEKYSSKEEMLKDIINIYGIPKEASFSGFDKYNRTLFDIDINKKKQCVSDISEIVSKLNFIDRLFIGNIHRIKK